MKAALACIMYLFCSFALSAQKRVLVRTPLEYGIVENGHRTGIWRYYDFPGILGMEIDYSTFDLLYFDPDTSAYVVQTNSGWVSEKLRRPCRYHGPYIALVEHFSKSLRTPYEMERRAKQKKEILQSVLTFDVGPDGSAANPLVSGYTGFGMQKMLMKAFKTAPNMWIPGIKMDGTPATCRFGVSVTFCPDTCQVTQSDAYTRIYGAHTSSKQPTSSKIWGTENTGLQFSPNNQWILIDSKLLSKTGGDGFIVVPAVDNRLNQLTRYIPYGNIQNGYWLDNDRIAFKYKYSLAPTLQGMYYLKEDSVATQLDSITYFDRISPDQTRLCVTDYDDETSRVVAINLATGEQTDMNVDPSLKPIPLLWSPDQRSIIFSGRKDNFDIIYKYDFEKNIYTQLPVMNVQPCGWKKDGKFLYAFRTNFPFANYSGELFELNLATNGFREITNKVDGLLFAEFSPDANEFLVVRNNNMFLLDPSDMQWTKVADNVSSATWSGDGKHIAFISEKGSFLNLYEVKTGKTLILHNQN